MTTKKESARQAGYTLVEIAIAIAALLLVGGGCYYVAVRTNMLPPPEDPLVVKAAEAAESTLRAAGYGDALEQFTQLLTDPAAWGPYLANEGGGWALLAIAVAVAVFVFAGKAVRGVKAFLVKAGKPAPPAGEQKGKTAKAA